MKRGKGDSKVPSTYLVTVISVLSYRIRPIRVLGVVDFVTAT